MTSRARVLDIQQHRTLETLHTRARQAYTAARRLCGPYSPIHRVYHAFVARAVGADLPGQIELARSAIACMEAFATLGSVDATALATDAGGPEPWRVNGHGRIAFRAAMSAHPALATFQTWDDERCANAGQAAMTFDTTSDWTAMHNVEPPQQARHAQA